MEELVDLRVAIVRALRREFGHLLIGGLLPSPFALRKYPDLVTEMPSGMRSYPAIVRDATIGVNSKGLHNSNGFKLGEYLASSLCIVSDEMKYELPAPLDAAANYLSYASADECVEQCSRLLSDPEARAEMQRRNWNYYREYVSPGALMMRCLETAFAESRDD
jgi:hypothetical protein